MTNLATSPVEAPTVASFTTNEGNLFLAVVAGFFAALAGAVIWAGVTGVTGYQVGWMAIGVGFLVGFAVRMAGKGRTAMFGITGAVLSLAGCLAGNVFAGCYFIAAENSVPMMEVVAALDLALATEILAAMFSPFDLLFYGLAIYEGFRFSLVAE